MLDKNNSNYRHDITKGFLIKEYSKNEKSMQKVANIINCERLTIRRRLIECNIPIRTLSEALKGIFKTEEHKNKIRLGNIAKHNHQGSNNPMFGKVGYWTGKRRPKHSKRMAGKNSPFYGRQTKLPKWGKYKGINMRSSWEIKFAKYLDKLGIKWQYEPKTFDLGSTTYTPDFKLSDSVYVEIKGYMSEIAYFKIKKFLKQYPDIKLQILMQKDLKNLKVL